MHRILSTVFKTAHGFWCSDQILLKARIGARVAHSCKTRTPPNEINFSREGFLSRNPPDAVIGLNEESVRRLIVELVKPVQLFLGFYLTIKFWELFTTFKNINQIRIRSRACILHHILLGVGNCILRTIRTGSSCLSNNVLSSNISSMFKMEVWYSIPYCIYSFYRARKVMTFIQDLKMCGVTISCLLHTWWDLNTVINTAVPQE